MQAYSVSPILQLAFRQVLVPACGNDAIFNCIISGCTCVIGKTENGLDVFQIIDDVYKCRCRAGETTNGCPPSLKKIMERNRKQDSEFVLDLF